jgi:uncharacterized protein YdiU (UPF0061 family)
MPLRFPFDNSYTRLPARLFARLDPTPVAAPRLVRLNAGLAASLGLDPDELSCSPFQVAGKKIPLLVRQAVQHGRRWAGQEARS